MVQHEGGYTDYANRKRWETEQSGKNGGGTMGTGKGSGMPSITGQKAVNAETSTIEAGKNWKSGQKRKLKFTFQEQKDYENIEGEMAKLEEKIKQIEEDYLKYSNDFVKLNELTKQKQEAEKLLEEKMERWMYLENLAARIEKGETVDI